MDLTDFDQRPPPKKAEKVEKAGREKLREANDAIEESFKNTRNPARIEPQQSAQHEWETFQKFLATAKVGEWKTLISLANGVTTYHITKDKPQVDSFGEHAVMIRSASFEVFVAVDNLVLLSIEQGRDEDTI